MATVRRSVLGFRTAMLVMPAIAVVFATAVSTVAVTAASTAAADASTAAATTAAAASTDAATDASTTVAATATAASTTIFAAAASSAVLPAISQTVFWNKLGCCWVKLGRKSRFGLPAAVQPVAAALNATPNMLAAAMVLSLVLAAPMVLTSVCSKWCSLL